MKLIDDCDFCSEQRGGSDHALYRRCGVTGDARRVWRDELFSVLPSLGPLTHGHRLLVPHEHVCSFGTLRDGGAMSASDILAWHIDRLRAEGMRLVCFEHGLGSAGSGGGCGVSHAHLHLIPLSMRGTRLTLPADIGGWVALPVREWPQCLERFDNYLMVYDGGESIYVTSAPFVPSQYLRRWFAGQIGVKQWDWRERGSGESVMAEASSQAAWYQQTAVAVGADSSGSLRHSLIC
jgi:diadenosine tetraphosphate (Ap4A) HIT family hydrolase